MREFYIIKLGEAPPATAALLGDFEHWIARGLGTTTRVVDPRSGGALPSPEHVLAAVLTGSHSMVTDKDGWIDTTAAWLAELIEGQVPVLGICYGHQLLAKAFGGEVNYHPLGKEVGTVEINLLAAAADDPLFGQLPTTFKAQTVHSQSVIRLPAEAVPLASNAFEPHHAFRVGASAWAVQFHPEFNADAMTAYIHEFASELQDEGFNPAQLERSVSETPESESLLRKFARYAARRTSID